MLINGSLLSFSKVLQSLLFFVGYQIQIYHHVTGNKYRREGSEEYTQAHGEGKIVQNGATKEIQSQCGKHGCTGCDCGP